MPTCLSSDSLQFYHSQTLLSFGRSGFFRNKSRSHHIQLDFGSLKALKSLFNNKFYFLHQAWKLWNEDNAADLIDEQISDASNRAEIMRCLHIGLLCVQEFPIHRPTISTVLSMLTSEIADLTAPEHPGFTDRWIRSHVGSSSTTQTRSINNVTLTAVEGR